MPIPNVTTIHLGVVIESRHNEVHIVNRNPNSAEFSVQVYYYSPINDRTMIGRVETGNLGKANFAGSSQFLGSHVIDGGAGRFYYSIKSVRIQKPSPPRPPIGNKAKVDSICPHTGVWQAEGYTHRARVVKNAKMPKYVKCKQWVLVEL